MSQYLGEDFIERVRESADIVSVLSQHLQLKKAGTNYKALCPFHLEKTPSFSVDPKRQIFKCFGCGKAGNVFHFLMSIEGTTFPETVVNLAEQYNIPIPEQEAPVYSKISRKNVEEAMAWSTVFFQKHLASTDGKQAREYLRSRKIIAQTVDDFQIGYAPNAWESLYQEGLKEGFTEECLEQAGLIIASKKKGGYYDRFRNRIMFPIWNSQGKIIAFGGRVLVSEDTPKYLNSPETNIFSKKRTLYAFHKSRPNISENQSLVIMEGYTDVLMAHQNGVSTAVATLGTSLTTEHANFIKRYTNMVTLVFDGDSAGVKAAFRSLSHFLSHGIMIKLVLLPEKLDPCDYISQHGPEAFSNLIKNAEDFFDFQLRQLQNKYDMSTTSARRNAIREIYQNINQIPDEITKKLFVRKIADTFKIPAETIFLEMEGKTRVKRPTASPLISNSRTRLHEEEEKFIMSCVFHYPQWRETIFSEYPYEIFENSRIAEFYKLLVEYLSEKEDFDIATFSSTLDPEMGKEIIAIYYNSESPESEENEKVNQRLRLILKGAERKRRKVKVAKLKEELNSVDQENKKQQILMNVHQAFRKNI